MEGKAGVGVPPKTNSWLHQCLHARSTWSRQSAKSPALYG